MKEETLCAIRHAISIIEENTSIENYHPLYMFSTENINGMLQGLEIKDKSILTVSASGDHIFNFL